MYKLEVLGCSSVAKEWNFHVEVSKSLTVVVRFERFFKSKEVEVAFSTFKEGIELSSGTEKNQLSYSEVRKVLLTVKAYVKYAIKQNPTLKFTAFPTTKSRENIYKKAGLPITFE